MGAWSKKESAPRPGQGAFTAPAQSDSSLLWTSYRQGSPSLPFHTYKFLLWLSCSWSIFFIRGLLGVEGRGGRHFVFEFIGLWTKGTHYPECLDFVMDEAPGWYFGLFPLGRRSHRYLVARRQSVTEMTSCPRSPYSLFIVLNFCWDMLQSQ